LSFADMPREISPRYLGLFTRRCPIREDRARGRRAGRTRTSWDGWYFRVVTRATPQASPNVRWRM
jgi:hypothetical protein